jgi:hypothetical protein
MGLKRNFAIHSDPMQEDEIGVACNTHGRDNKFTQKV